MGSLMHLGPDFSPFGHDLLLEKIFLVTRDTECCTKLFSDSHNFFTLFLQHVSLTLFYLCPRKFLKVLLALILGGPSKSCVFEKIYTLSFQLHVEHPLRMQATSRFWLR